MFNTNMFRGLSFYSNKSLSRLAVKLSVTMFVLAVFTGASIMFAGMASKSGNAEETLKHIGVAIVLLLTFVFLYAFLRTRVMLEIEKRLNLRSKI